jgi:hypothetical protein
MVGIFGRSMAVLPSWLLAEGGVDGGGQDAVGEEVSAEEEDGDEPPGRAEELDAEVADDGEGEPEGDLHGGVS